MKSLTPNTFRTGGIVDDERVNGNLRRAADDVNRNLDKRYTYCPPIVVPLDGMANTDGAGVRTIRFARPAQNADRPIEIVRVEIYIYSAGGANWTVTQSQTTWASLVVATAGSTTEAYAVSTTPIAVPTGTGVDFVFSADAASTLTRAWMVIHCRADRGVQGAAANHAGYSPTFVDSSTSTAGATLDAQLTALAAAVTRDTANANDLRCVCLARRNFTTTGLSIWNLPSGAGFTGLGYNAVISATNLDAVTLSGSLGTPTITGTGTANIVTSTGTPTSTSDDPLTTASDFVVGMSSVSGTIESFYIFVWWS